MNFTGSMNRRESEDRKYEKIKSNSGKLQIGPQIYDNVKVEQLQIKAELGSGSYGNVTQRVIDNRLIAVKEMKKTSNEEENKRIYMDLQVITCNDCPFIVKSYGYIITFDHVYICMEKMEMCLDKLYKNEIKPKNLFIPEQILGQITVSVVKALKYLKNELEIMHRDVKPSNILINYSGNIKLCDFGIAGKIIDSEKSTGCAAYLSPERMQGTQYDFRADIWALGISLIELATLEHPYQLKSYMELFCVITGMPSPTLPVHFASEFREFVDKCLEKSAQRRPNYTELQNMKWYQNHFDLDCDVENWILNVLGLLNVSDDDDDW